VGEGEELISGLMASEHTVSSLVASVEAENKCKCTRKEKASKSLESQCTEFSKKVLPWPMAIAPVYRGTWQ
jgi:Na+-transporting NADH:ubiquinone oxidoreductase subunit NqrF